MRNILDPRLNPVFNNHFSPNDHYPPMSGAFTIQGPTNGLLRIISSGSEDNDGWEHVSVSLAHRTPNWYEMQFVKDLFWREDECVIQYHPPKSQYINNHPNVLHMWKPVNVTIPVPPLYMV